MAYKDSTGLANELTDRNCLRQIIQGGRLLLFSSTQPTNADTASNGTLLGTITLASGAFTGETLPVWKITLAGTAGSLDSIKMGGLELLAAAVNFTTDLTTTAAAVAAAITNGYSLIDYTATGSGADILITGPKGSGAALNATTCVATATTLTATVANTGSVFTAGVDTVNGLKLTFPAVSGAVNMSGTWSGAGVAAGTATWFRYLCDAADTGTGNTSTFRRIDGSVTATGGGGDCTIDNTSVSVGQTVTVTSFLFGIDQG